MTGIKPVSTIREKSEKVRHEELAVKISQNTRLSKKDTMLMLQALPFALIDSLEIEGDKVHMDSLGTFTVTLRKGKVDNLKIINGERVKTKRRDKLFIKFSPSSKFIPYSEQDLEDELK